MNRQEAAELIDKQDHHLATKGRFAGMAPGVNLGQLHKAQRILAGEEEEDVQRPADLAKHHGPLVPEAVLASIEVPAPEKVFPTPKEMGLVPAEGESSVPAEPEPPAADPEAPPAPPAAPPTE